MLTRELLAKVRKIEIRTRRIVDELTGGAYHSVFKGKGIEFNEVREYLAGDDVRAIDWNVTARMGLPYIKKFVEERELTVFLLVDISASGDFGSRGRAKNEHFAELAAVLAFSAVRNQDQVGLLMFSDQEELYLPPRKGRRHVLRLVRDLLACERRSRGTNIAHALQTMMRVVKRRAVVFVLSDFMDSDFQTALRSANRYHDVVALRVHDPCELAIPVTRGLLSVEDAESGKAMIFPSFRRGAREAYATQMRDMRAATERSCLRAGVDLIDIRNDEDYVAPIMRFFRQRQQRRLH